MYRSFDKRLDQIEALERERFRAEQHASVEDLSRHLEANGQVGEFLQVMNDTRARVGTPPDGWPGSGDEWAVQYLIREYSLSRNEARQELWIVTHADTESLLGGAK